MSAPDKANNGPDLFNDVPDKINFPEVEHKMAKFWEDIDAFQTSLKLSEGKPEYVFLDGPPFATGLPHYGHILAGTIKDIITRFFHQKGYHVRRQWGWDCHGLPIEFEIDKLLGIKTKSEVEELGIANYNAECRKIVMRFSAEWEKTVARTGRWIDFEHDYKTMYPWFMESIWWIFTQLFEKGLVYRGVKVMPFSTACTTPLSNFEANQAYQDTTDPSIIISFPVVGAEDGRKFVAWTTTPWTLPSNLALCVNKDLDYVLIKDLPTGELWYLMEARLPQLYPPKKKSKPKYEVLEKMKGQALVGMEYEPLFDYFMSFRDHGAFRVICDPYVSADSGTGIVHCAPGFGEDDFRICLAAGIIGKKVSDIPCPIDLSGCFTNEVTDWTGVYIKDADTPIMKNLKARGRLVQQSSITHSYPFCWRSDTPLIYRAVPSWFINVESIRDRLVEALEKTYWVPDHVKEKRFRNWLEGARDWCVSRSRYWGTPLPLWVSDDFEEIVCIGSIEDLEKHTGRKVEDLHRENLDDLVIKSKQGKGDLHRVPEVFDCWFESGSMPFASRHYPFENMDVVDEHYPANFIAEGLDQTRGWFYTLMVIGCAIKDGAPFKNLIVNGLVLASDGKKMSKRLQNYPDPNKVMDEVGADALRLYLTNSPVVRAESLRFTLDGVVRVVKELFLPWYNAYRFFVQNANIYAMETGSMFHVNTGSDNIMDRWILASLQSLIAYVHREIEGYRLYTVVPRMIRFLEELTNWYVRFNRRRLKGAYGRDGQQQSLATLFEVLVSMSTIMAPLTPFICEFMYQNLRRVMPGSEESVHYRMLPVPRLEAVDEEVERAMSRLEAVVSIVRITRERNVLPVKTPLKQITVVHRDPQYHEDLKTLEQYMVEELNVKSMLYSVEEGAYVKLQAVSDDKTLGKKLGKKLREVKVALTKLTPDQLADFESTHHMEIAGVVLGEGDVRVERVVAESGPGEGLVIESGADGVVVVVDFNKDESIVNEGIARDVVSRIMKMRKGASLVRTDLVDVFYETSSAKMTKAMTDFSDFILKNSNSSVYPVSCMECVKSIVLADVEKVFNGDSVRLVMVRRGFAYDKVEMTELYGDLSDTLSTAINQMDYTKLLKEWPGSLTVCGKTLKVALGKGIYESIQSLKGIIRK